MSEYRKRPPTMAEIVAHAEKHQVEMAGITAMWMCRNKSIRQVYMAFLTLQEGRPEGFIAPTFGGSTPLTDPMWSEDVEYRPCDPQGNPVPWPNLTESESAFMSREEVLSIFSEEVGFPREDLDEDDMFTEAEFEDEVLIGLVWRGYPDFGKDTVPALYTISDEVEVHVSLPKDANDPSNFERIFRKTLRKVVFTKRLLIDDCPLPEEPNETKC